MKLTIFTRVFFQFFFRFHQSLNKRIKPKKSTDFPLTRLQGIMSELKVTNAAY